MVMWIQSEPPAVIAAIVFGLSYLVALTILGGCCVVSQWRAAAHLRATTPVMLTPLSVIAGLLIAFLAARVWGNLDRAASSIGEEASSIRQAVLFTEACPPETRARVRDDIGKYLRFIETDDWPAMAAGRATLRRSPPGLTEAMLTVLAFTPASPGEQLAQQRATQELETALIARRHRILVSQAVLSSIQWGVIILLAVLILLTIGMVHIHQPATAAVNLFVFSTAVAACLVLLLAYDRPFAAGGFTLSPTAFREVGISH